MKKLLRVLLIPSLLIWLVPFLISFAFYDQEGNQVGNFYVFKLVMIIASTGTAYFALRRIYKEGTFTNVMQNSLVVFFYQILIDAIVLIGLISMPLSTYVLTVIPVYVFFIPLTNIILKRVEAKK